ncbi:histidine ammonia-lyase-like [Corticium candelabrum]|uniref:histidine ammonia-lyase-like n=1 Tax=Corticium candelabrum TaxID=121492 RepID=UPI002E26D941|nr:histidine ammonia-lyase-like [Corticium candelabrum]
MSEPTRPSKALVIDGCSLTPADLHLLGRGDTKIELAECSVERVKKARQQVDKIVAENRVVYGITTGFGKFARTSISPEKLGELQCNLIRSHAAGVGNPLTPERTRMLLALRINVLAKGYSGISLHVLQQYVDAFNASCLPWVPEKGSVGASGDLAPLSHLALGLMGEGKMWSKETGWKKAKEVLDVHGLTPIVLSPKEGLALINGTQLITALGAECVERAAIIARQADVIAAMTLEALKGTNRAFNKEIHELRPHRGQKEVAARFRALIHSDFYTSEIADPAKYDKVQDPYSLRCCPQVHGIVLDTIDFVRNLLTTEMNSATDNPIVLPESDEIISAGNFHGEYPAKALDYLAIGVHELASISQCRIERMLNPALSDLPAFLVEDGGLNSGFMLAHCTAAALVSENKVLCHPSSVDSISTSAATEDHVSMGGWSARKALTIVEHVEQVLAIELLASCQALDMQKPLRTTAPLQAVYSLVRDEVGIRKWTKDRFMSPDIDIATKVLQEDKVWKTVEPFVKKYQAAHELDTISNGPFHEKSACCSDVPSSHTVDSHVASASKRQKMD